MELVWFLAPTVALVMQQHDVIAAHIPSAKTRTMTGQDNVDTWTSQTIWNNVLKDVRVVCSTHAVLSDALNHGFVRMAQLALLVFDEGKSLTAKYQRKAIGLITVACQLTIVHDVILRIKSCNIITTQLKPSTEPMPSPGFWD